jgi:hypothetical protein
LNIPHATGRRNSISSITQLLFGCIVFIASFLLFLIEPICAKQLVPIFGGSASVWITCLVFFQTALLAGYLYAHWLSHHTTRKRMRVVHVGLLLLAALSTILWVIAHGPSTATPLNPFLTIFQALTVSIGLPFILLASTSPLLQLWFSRLTQDRVPYRFFALSNLASLLALGLYPSAIEPYFTLRTQRAAWGLGFLAFLILSLMLLRRIKAGKCEEATIQPKFAAIATAAHIKLLWLLLPMGAAMQLSAITSHLTENIAAIPLLWILPLATYLLTLIVAFEFPRFVPRSIVLRLMAIALASLGYMLAKVDVSLPIKVSIPIYLIELFIACLFCHSSAYVLRPQKASESTMFYLMLAAGGALGSFFTGVASPLIFSSNYDLAISFTVSALLALVVTWEEGWAQRLLWSTGSGLLLYLIILLHTAFQHNSLLATRNFYGSLRVEQKNAGTDGVMRTLMNGTIRHGMQVFSPALSKTPTTYYAEDSGIGLALRFCCTGRAKKVGVIGLGVGTIAAYGQPGDSIRFYEINPAVLPIAQHLFTYLRDSPAQISVVEGDARASLAGEPPQHFDVLAIDAFSGDSIPLHLLTQEAIAIYQKHLAPGGILAFHVSNQYVDLEPEISLLAQSAGMQAQTVLSAEDNDRGEFRATWVLVTRDASFFNTRGVVLRSTPTEQRNNLRVWTDDYSSLLPVLDW